MLPEPAVVKGLNRSIMIQGSLNFETKHPVQHSFLVLVLDILFDFFPVSQLTFKVVVLDGCNGHLAWMAPEKSQWHREICNWKLSEDLKGQFCIRYQRVSVRIEATRAPIYVLSK